MLSVILLILAFTSCEPEESSDNKENTKDSLKNANEYVLVWSDDFQYKGLPDSSKWSYDTEGNASGWGNNEYQHYTEKNIENAFVDGEFLHIKAIEKKIGKKNYTSARIISKKKGDWLYGKFEIRAKLPEGKGIWPAIWMLPTDWEYGGWPESGEIDIMEHVGYMPDSVFASVHTESYNHIIGTQKTKGIFLPDCEDEFHTYILEWEENEIRMYVDTIHYFTFNKENTGHKEWPFDKRFHILLNVAVGGNWGALKGFDKSIIPCEMTVDFVKVYQKK